jgi:hypothetical protein
MRNPPVPPFSSRKGLIARAETTGDTGVTTMGRDFDFPPKTAWRTMVLRALTFPTERRPVGLTKAGTPEA